MPKPNVKRQRVGLLSDAEIELDDRWWQIERAYTQHGIHALEAAVIEHLGVEKHRLGGGTHSPPLHLVAAYAWPCRPVKPDCKQPRQPLKPAQSLRNLAEYHRFKTVEAARSALVKEINLLRAGKSPEIKRWLDVTVGTDWPRWLVIPASTLPRKKLVGRADKRKRASAAPAKAARSR